MVEDELITLALAIGSALQSRLIICFAAGRQSNSMNSAFRFSREAFYADCAKTKS
jgi:hypothetical protein